MEVGLAVGGAFLSSGLQVLFDRLAPQGDLLNMFRKRKNDVKLLEKLEDTLVGLQDVLSDAENKQASNRRVRRWFNKLQSAVDSAENLIEEVNYEALRRKVEGQHLAETTRNQQVSDDFFLNIKDKLEDTMETLKDLQEQIGFLGLKEHLGSTNKEPRTPSTSVVEESGIFGRQKEIQELIDRLLSEDANGKNLDVVPIIGMAGAGKTTLAKVVYNDERVKNHFPLKAWYCVSEAYDALGITKGLLQEIHAFDPNDDNNLNLLQVKLKESLKGKKFLVVLDDVWNDNYIELDDLRNLFVLGDIGSKIIVTTRNVNVTTKMMGHGEIDVGILSGDDSWALFKRHSLENRDTEENPELEDVGKQIADKCKGLPLALKALAGVLRCKPEVEQWRNILRSEIWDQPSCSDDILPALMLSYNDLPPDLKRCFAFCAIYPKDYQFCKDQVIHLWIANGLVKQFCSGNEYFLELRSRSLFERVPESGSKPEGFSMHDLVNDLAKNASSNLCIRLEENKGSHMLEQCRHISYSIGEDGDFAKLKSLFKSEQLRTLLPIITNQLLHSNINLSKRVQHNILPRLTSLRALSLSHYQIKELPDELFIKLKLLRFLDLSETRIEKLPDSICALYYLETLLLSSCADLEELPLQMEKLINLRHLDISNTPRLKMPPHLSKLKSLQVLVGAKFLVGGSRMEDLGEEQKLYGSLSVLGLQNVVDRREAVKAKMREKDHVDKLSLEWSGSDVDNSQRDILDELRPHENIKELQITGYRGLKFPNWLADPSFLKNCVQMCLRNCKKCDSLPALGQLPSLKILSIRGMDGITKVTEEFYGSLSSKKPFNSLEELEFEDMPEWKEWHVLGNGEFPTLEYLSIKNCPELSLETPIQLSRLKIFVFIGCPKFVLFDEAQVEGMKQIEQLYIKDCNSLASLPFSILPSTLKRISICRCQKLKLEGPVGEMFLEYLIISECDCIDDISPELLPRARQLWVERCPNLTRFLIPTATESLFIWNCENVEKVSVACGNLPSAMTILNIEGCLKLKKLPERMQELLPSLKQLYVYNCPEIESFPEGGLPSSIQKLTICNLRSSQLLNSLTSLEYLCIQGNLPHIQSLLEEGQLPSSLSHLDIWDCPNLQSLSESALPSSLSHLTISDCPNLQSLSELALPSSLSDLAIINCPNLQSLPVKGMPSSLSILVIRECPVLRPLLQFEKGEYWPNIAQIPIIEIDEKYL